MDQIDRTVISGYSFAVANVWHDVPLLEDRARSWSAELVRELGTTGPAMQTLERELGALQTRLAGSFGPGARAMVWIPQPETGYAGGTLVVTVWRLGADDIRSPAEFVESFQAPDSLDAGDTLLERTLWTGEFSAGPFGAVHQVLTSPGDDPSTTSDEETVVEQTAFAVFPTGADEFVQFAFVAESIASFERMPEQTQAIVASLSVQLGRPS